MDIACVGAIIRDGEGRIVVVQRRNPPDEHRWSIPGGRVEPDESPVDALKREVLEETGLHVEIEHIAGTVDLKAPTGEDRYLVTDYFARVAPGTTTTPTPGDDAAEARWVTFADLVALDLTRDLAETLQQWETWAESS